MLLLCIDLDKAHTHTQNTKRKAQKHPQVIKQHNFIKHKGTQKAHKNTHKNKRKQPPHPTTQGEADARAGADLESSSPTHVKVVSDQLNVERHSGDVAMGDLPSADRAE